MTKFKCNTHTFDVSNEDKKLFLPSAITKGDLMHYYCDVADYILPFSKNHCLTMIRYPNGIQHEGFYQKDAPDYFPKWIKTFSVPKHEGGSTRYVVANNIDTFPYIANQGCITPHLWLSRIDKLDFPDRMIFDLDPGKQSFNHVQQTALALRELLDALNLTSFPMTTGSHGMHVWVPLNRRSNFDTVRAFAQELAKILIAHDENHLTLEVRIEKRKGKLFIDTLRNGFGAIAVAPYGVRPKKDAPIATPLDWSEVGNSKLTSQKYNISNIFKRLDKKGDVWKQFHQSAGSISTAQKKLDKLKFNLG